MKKKNLLYLGILVLTLVSMGSCRKYYFDSGIHDPRFNGTTIDFLEAKAPYFDTTLMVIELADMQQVLQQEEVTFFAPPSSTVRNAVVNLNRYLLFNGKDTISKLTQIKPAVWREVLQQYIFKGKSLLKDYPQKDTVAYITYPGQNYASYGGRIMNIGAVYQDAAGVQYAGYRQLFLTYIPDLSNPQVGLQNNAVATSDIQTNNGVIHVLTRGKHSFGFQSSRFIDQVLSAGIDLATP